MSLIYLHNLIIVVKLRENWLAMWFNALVPTESLVGKLLLLPKYITFSKLFFLLTECKNGITLSHSFSSRGRPYAQATKI